MWLTANGFGVPDEFTFPFGRVSPCDLICLQTLFDLFFGLSKQYWDILYSMKAIGNKEWNHYNVTSSSVLVTAVSYTHLTLPTKA